MQHRMLMLFGILSGLALGGCAGAPAESGPSAVTAASKAPTAGEASAATTAPSAITINLDVNPSVICPVLPPDCCHITIVSGCKVCDVYCL